jgi:glycosyltransferase involved in cell wall biosynthesis
MIEPFVSIFINNYNYARFLPRSIESALPQTWRRLEVLAVDDASTDGSQEIIARYAGRVVPVLQAANGGQGAAINAGIRVSRGDVVMLLDADDWLYPEAASRVAAAFGPGVGKVRIGDGGVLQEA